MEKKSISYEGYTITANPRRVSDKEMWTVDLLISRGGGEDLESWLISAGEQAEIDDGALEYCFNFGKQVIDNEMKE